jgi:hypothetical protein
MADEKGIMRGGALLRDLKRPQKRAPVRGDAPPPINISRTWGDILRRDMEILGQNAAAVAAAPNAGKIAFLQQFVRGMVTKIVTKGGLRTDAGYIDHIATSICARHGPSPGPPTRSVMDVSSSYSQWLSSIFLLPKVKWRGVLEHISPTNQCIGALGPRWNEAPCYICARPAQDPMECEHKLPIIMALSFWGLIQKGPIPAAEHPLFALEYANSHKCCNRIKSNYDFIVYNSRTNLYEINAPLIRSILSIISQSGDEDCTKLGDKFVLADIKTSLEAALNPIIEKINENLTRSGDPRSGDPRSGDPRSGDPEKFPEIFHLISIIKILWAIDPDHLNAAMQIKAKIKRFVTKQRFIVKPSGLDRLRDEIARAAGILSRVKTNRGPAAVGERASRALRRLKRPSKLLKGGSNMIGGRGHVLVDRSMEIEHKMEMGLLPTSREHITRMNKGVTQKSRVKNQEEENTIVRQLEELKEKFANENHNSISLDEILEAPLNVILEAYPEIKKAALKITFHPPDGNLEEWKELMDVLEIPPQKERHEGGATKKIHRRKGGNRSSTRRRTRGASG